ncbi:MAG: hypothetical protein K1X53_15555 [Candidatus Sumerlaeaceae bacterium]|nr:hypothetical protein [Candidatus Sumerlaeaceae bacterium]
MGDKLLPGSDVVASAIRLAVASAIVSGIYLYAASLVYFDSGPDRLRDDRAPGGMILGYIFLMFGVPGLILAGRAIYVAVKGRVFANCQCKPAIFLLLGLLFPAFASLLPPTSARAFSGIATYGALFLFYFLFFLPSWFTACLGSRRDREMLNNIPREAPGELSNNPPKPRNRWPTDALKLAAASAFSSGAYFYVAPQIRVEERQYPQIEGWIPGQATVAFLFLLFALPGLILAVRAIVAAQSMGLSFAPGRRSVAVTLTFLLLPATATLFPPLFITALKGMFHDFIGTLWYCAFAAIPCGLAFLGATRVRESFPDASSPDGEALAMKATARRPSRLHGFKRRPIVCLSLFAVVACAVALVWLDRNSIGVRLACRPYLWRIEFGYLYEASGGVQRAMLNNETTVEGWPLEDRLAYYRTVAFAYDFDASYSYSFFDRIGADLKEFHRDIVRFAGTPEFSRLSARQQRRLFETSNTITVLLPLQDANGRVQW